MGLARNPVPATRYEQLTGKKISRDSRVVWDRVYNKNKFVYGKSPAKFLSQNYQYIPPKSEVLDLGMGEGRNAVFLAQKGHSVTGIDISPMAVKKSGVLADEFGVTVKAITADLNKYDFPANSFDSIICFYYVDRDLIERMKKWLKPKGIIIFEAYGIKQRKLDGKKADPISYYLREGELLSIFKDFKVLKFEEPEHRSKFTSSIIIKKK